METIALAHALAAELRPKGMGTSRVVLGRIKEAVYRPVLAALDSGGLMSFDDRLKGHAYAVPQTKL